MNKVVGDNSKTVLITGCNRGIGKAILVKFAQLGYNILACVRQIDADFPSFIADIANENNIQIESFAINLQDEESIRLFTHQLIINKRQIDVLINNAGVVTKGLLLMTSIEHIKEVFQVNFFGQVQLTQGICKLMMHQKHGTIINVCSIGGIDSYPGYTAYGCSKASMCYFTKTMSQELAQYGIRVNGVAPSMTNTRMKEEMGKQAMDEMLHRSAIKRIADPKEIANVVTFLASEESSYVNGQIIRVDGGM